MSFNYAKSAEQFQNNSHFVYSPFANILASEMIVAIFERFENWQDVMNGQNCCKKFRKILQANSIKMVRCPVDFKITKNNNEGWKLELERKLDGKKRIEKEMASLELFEVANLQIIGPIDGKNLEILAEKLKIGRQKRIQSIFMENINFENYIKIVNWLFNEQKYCRKIHFKNCKFGNLKEIQNDGNLIESLGQFKLENDYKNDEMDEGIDSFSQSILDKFAWDLRFRMRRHPIPIIWDAPLPNGQLSKSFLIAICKFIENWLSNSDAPHFHISIKNCPPHFCGHFTEHCAHFGISQIFMHFPSRAHYCAHIKGKYNRENRTFELFPIHDIPARANAIFMARFYRDI